MRLPSVYYGMDCATFASSRNNWNHWYDKLNQSSNVFSASWYPQL